MKGQVSTELLIIVAVVLLIFIPLLVLVYFKASEATEQMNNYQAELTVFRLAYMANSVGNLGEGAKVYSDVYIPANTKTLKIRSVERGGEIVLTLKTNHGDTEIMQIIKPIVAENKTYTLRQGWARFEINHKKLATGESAVVINKK